MSKHDCTTTSRRGLVQAAIDWRWSSVRHYTLEVPPDDPLVPKVHGLPIGLDGPYT